MEQRVEKRLNHCLEVNFGDNGTSQRGWTRNISRHGMLISSENSLFHLKNAVKISMKIGSDSIVLDGVVCWNNECQDAWDFPENQMGLFIQEPPPRYCDYISRLL